MILAPIMAPNDGKRQNDAERSKVARMATALTTTHECLAQSAHARVRESRREKAHQEGRAHRGEFERNRWPPDVTGCTTTASEWEHIHRAAIQYYTLLIVTRR